MPPSPQRSQDQLTARSRHRGKSGKDAPPSRRTICDEVRPQLTIEKNAFTSSRQSEGPSPIQNYSKHKIAGLPAPSDAQLLEQREINRNACRPNAGHSAI